MEYYDGIDVSLKESSLCVVDAKGKIVREAKVASDPETLSHLVAGTGFPVTRRIFRTPVCSAAPIA